MNQDVYPVLFCNTAWMLHYRGDDKNDPQQHGGRWVTSGETGHEVYNFYSHRGKVYGYVKPKNYSIAIERLGAEPDSDSISGVRVYWTARHPRAGRCVIGWYHNATVYRDMVRRPRSGFKGKTYYNITAKDQDKHLIPPDDRALLPVPHSRTAAWGMSQSQVRYMTRDGMPFLRQLEKRLAPPAKRGGKKTLARTRTGAGRQLDTAKKLAVEQAAMEAVQSHYSNNWELKDTSRTMRLGYDFLATPRMTDNTVKLYLEVKGCSGSQIACELTPSEYECMESPGTKAHYRLCVVTNALEPGKRQVHIFSYHSGLKKWIDNHGHKLRVDTLQSARCAAG